MTQPPTAAESGFSRPTTLTVPLATDGPHGAILVSCDTGCIDPQVARSLTGEGIVLIGIMFILTVLTFEVRALRRALSARDRRQP